MDEDTCMDEGMDESIRRYTKVYEGIQRYTKVWPRYTKVYKGMAKGSKRREMNDEKAVRRFTFAVNDGLGLTSKLT